MQARYKDGTQHRPAFEDAATRRWQRTYRDRIPSSSSDELLCKLADGGTARVELALHRGADGFEKLVAVKRLLPEAPDDGVFAAMLIDEARVLAGIRHPSVREVYDFGREASGAPYLVMEFLMGEPLSEVLKALASNRAKPRFTHEQYVLSSICARLADGLHATHELRDMNGPLDVVHRDVTPQNLFVLHDGSVRVTDYGIVRARNRRQKTGGRTLKGKMAYMSPEYLRRDPYDRRSDVWAMGVVLWELLTATRLFRRGTDFATVEAILSEPIPRPSTVRADVMKKLDDIAMRALDRDMERRYQSAAELAYDLECVVQQGPRLRPSDTAKWLSHVLPDSLDNLQGLVARARARARPSAPPPQEVSTVWPPPLPVERTTPFDLVRQRDTKSTGVSGLWRRFLDYAGV